MIYFDNAATSKFKPFAVRRAAARALRESANPGRSGHRDAIGAAFIVEETRSVLAEYLHAADANVVFTKNCTEALNIAILGTAKLGGHVITTNLEHNSVLRPLHMLRKEGLISLTIVEADRGYISAEEIERAIRDKTYLVAVTSMSNVTGYAPPLKEIGAICKRRGILFSVDGAQGIGHTPIDVSEMHIDLLSGAGHKSLHGAQGTGFLVFGKDIFINPLTYGGTGTESDRLTQPMLPPESLESGTLNLTGIAALRAAVRWTSKHQEALHKKYCALSKYIYRELSEIEGTHIFSVAGSPIVTFTSDRADADVIADRLNEEFDIAVRCGLHCAPLALPGKGSLPSVRISIGANNNLRQARKLVKALRHILTKKNPQECLN